MLAQQTSNNTTVVPSAYKAQNGTSSQGCAPAAMMVGQAAPGLQPSAAATNSVVKSDFEWSVLFLDYPSAFWRIF